LIFSLAFGKAWSPFAIKIRTDHPDKYRQVYGEVLLILIFVMLLVGGGVAMFSGEIISLIMPVEYSSSALPLLVLCFAVI
jgi:O-antigen/teichoic acid export membrane protein